RDSSPIRRKGDVGQLVGRRQLEQRSSRGSVPQAHHHTSHRGQGRAVRAEGQRVDVKVGAVANDGWARVYGFWDSDIPDGDGPAPIPRGEKPANRGFSGRWAAVPAGL